MIVTVRSRIPVRFFYDQESRNWGFSVQEPGVVGGGDATLEEARHHAAEAIAFALEGTGQDRAQDGQLEYLEVAVG